MQILFARIFNYRRLDKQVITKYHCQFLNNKEINVEIGYSFMFVYDFRNDYHTIFTTPFSLTDEAKHRGVRHRKANIR